MYKYNVPFEHEPEYIYHGKAKDYLSSHALADFRKSPLLYHRKQLGIIKDKYNPAYVLGSATHKLVLEGEDAFRAEYVVSDGPINPKTAMPYGKTTKAYMEWAEQQTQTIISKEEYTFCVMAKDSVWRHPDAFRLLDEGTPEGVLREMYNLVPCQIRADWFNPDLGLVDYKTCAELQYFENDCRRYGYIYQMAFYRAVIRMVIGENVPVHIIATEKCEPYATGVWRITDSVLDDAEAVNFATMRRLREAYTADIWHSGYEDLRVISQL